MGFELAKEDIKHIIDNMDFHMNGQITYSSFLAATVNLKEQLSEKLLQKTFSYFDSSGNGCITQTDLRLSLKSLGHVATHKEIKHMQQEYRFTEPGKISYLEYRKMMINEFTPKYTPHPLKAQWKNGDEEESGPEDERVLSKIDTFSSMSSKCQKEYNRRRSSNTSA